MQTNVLQLPHRETPATPDGTFEDSIAAGLVANSPEVAYRIAAAITRHLDAGVARIMEASRP